MILILASSVQVMDHNVNQLNRKRVIQMILEQILIQEKELVMVQVNHQH